METQVAPQNMVGNLNQTSDMSYALRRQSLIASAIAMLSDREIQSMNPEDLLDALRMAQLTRPTPEFKNILNIDVSELRRILAIVREHFREQMNQQLSRKKWSPEFN